ncbi:MAG: B12-binding domain-containing radical SAM protein [Promethearchaeota archaeon]
MSASSHPPLGLAMIATVLKQANHDVQVIDAMAERLNIYRVREKLKEFQPEIIGITTMISFSRNSVALGKWLKRHYKSIPIMFGGPWASIEYSKILESRAGDYAVIGEGEVTVIELIDAIENGRALENVRGIAYLKDGDVFKTGAREHITDLDSLPFPDWGLFPKPKNYFFDSKGKNFYPVMTSRGCPLGCIHCTKLIHGYKIRMRSVESVIEEIKYIRKHFKADEIIFADDNFNYDVERAEKICDGLIALDFKMALRFSNGVRADKLTPRLAWKLKKAGAYDIALGIESGNQGIVYKIGKNLDLNKVRRAAKILRRLNIFSRGFFMLGLPNETVHTFLDTKRFMLEIDLDIAHIYKVIPFPGTRMYDIVKKQGKFLESYLKGKNYYSLDDAVFEFDNMPMELVELAREDIHRSFYFRPSKIFSLLKKFRLLKNFRWLLNGVLRVIINVYKNKNRTATRNTKEIILERLRLMREASSKENV